MNGRKRILMTAIGLAALGASIVLTGCGGGGGNGGGIGGFDPLKIGLIHEWKLDGDAKDSVGTLDGTVHGPVVFANTPTGARFVGDGQSTGITIPPIADMQFQNSFTISAWASTPTAAPFGHLWEAIFFEGDDRSGLDPYYLMVDASGQLSFQVCSASESAYLYATMPVNKLSLITGTYDKTAGLLRLYINGSMVAQKSTTKATPVVPLDAGYLPGIGLGGNNAFPNSGFNFSWNGAIDDMRVYNRALSASEVQSLYKQGV